jgi:hypothetical protein
VLCCLLGGVLAAAVARSARRSRGRPHNPLLGLLFGFGAGMLLVALTLSVLAPLGVVDVTGPLPPRIALLALPAVTALAASQAGGAGALLIRSATMGVTLAAIGGALLAEELHLHILTLHSAPGIVAGVAVHSQAVLLLIAGLAWRATLPPEGAREDLCGCEPAPAEADDVRAEVGRPDHRLG